MRPDAIASGYWFVANYIDLESKPPDSAFQPYQIGPHIFDGDGVSDLRQSSQEMLKNVYQELVWSGAPLVSNSVTHDFKVSIVNGSAHLSYSLSPRSYRGRQSKGAGILLDSSYQVKQRISNSVGDGLMDLHEFNVINGGRSALMVTHRDISITFPSADASDKLYSQRMDDNGFQEVDIITGQTMFEWWALDHIRPNDIPGPVCNSRSAEEPWDFFHINSVEKDDDGNFIISSRCKSTIYKISSTDGTIIWQLGGARSNFTIPEGAQLSLQHDARIISSSRDVAEVSMLNNFAAKSGNAGNESIAQILSLNMMDMVATEVQRIRRPDGAITAFRGNFQVLPNGNRLVGWSGPGRLTEHTPDGALALQARFTSDRYITYRAYKFDWVGHPNEPPALALLASGGDDARVPEVTIAYVSWNGATEVHRWLFFAALQGSGRDELVEVGNVLRTGFETECVMHGPVRSAYAVAMSISGEELGASAMVGSRRNSDGEPVKWDFLLPRKILRPAERRASHAAFLVVAGFMAGYISARRRK